LIIFLFEAFKIFDFDAWKFIEFSADLPAKGGDPALKYLKEVENSDTYIGIIGNKYGNKGKDGLSLTEREFQTFIKSKTTNNAFIFIKGKDDSEKDKEMQKFIEKARKSYIYKRFNNTDDLKLWIKSLIWGVYSDIAILYILIGINKELGCKK